jgi:hypothetical protein
MLLHEAFAFNPSNTLATTFRTKNTGALLNLLHDAFSSLGFVYVRH